MVSATMYCPNCGKENSPEQSFCRACGLRLKAISEVLARELSPGGAADVDQLQPSPGPRKLGSQPLLLAGFLTMMFGVIVGVLGKKMLSTEWISTVGALIAILGMSLMGYAAITFKAPLSRRSATSIRLPPIDLTTDRQLAAPPASVASVTENTTRELETAPGKGSRDASSQ
jgi:hypothetical protein